jgi:hypothetical protein
MSLFYSWVTNYLIEINEGYFDYKDQRTHIAKIDYWALGNIFKLDILKIIIETEW